jgi:release factor glutamine methyltransferase
VTQPATQAWSRREAWRWGAGRLRAAGIEPHDAQLEAEVLLRHAAGVTREELLVRPLTLLAREAASAYEALIARRAAGIPGAYLVGHREFFGIDLLVDPRVMIPRPETERLVELLVEALQNRPAPLVVDIGTGSGAIAIAVARSLPRARVLATDISKGALEVAQVNAARGGVADRITWAEGPGLEPLSRAELEGRVDAVASNPPYIPTEEIGNLPREVREGEPAIALDGGPDGLTVHRPIIRWAGRYLVPGGILALEVAAVWRQSETVARLVDATGLFTPARIARDDAGAERVVMANRVGLDGNPRG